MIITSPVRRADRRDEAELLAICHEVHEEIGLFPMDDARVREHLEKAFTRNGAIIGVIGPPGKLEGAIYLMISDFWYTDHWHLGELFNFVRAPYRKSDNAKNLIQFAKRCADELALPAIIGIISTERTMPKVRLYQRQLGTAAGAFFVYQPPIVQTGVQAQRAAG